MLADGFEHPVGDRDYIRDGGQITEGRPGGLTFPDNGTAPSGEPYGIVAADPTADGWYSATDHGEFNPDYSGYHLGEGWNSSTGDDLGEPVYSVANGTVVRMGDDGIGLYGQAFGNCIVIRHGMPEGPPVYSFCAHLDEINSEIYTAERGDVIGATVTRGQQIGTIGTTGASDFPHLHFEIYRGTITTTEEILDERGYSSTARPNGWVDPTDFIDANRVVEGSDQFADLTVEIASVSNFGPGATATISVDIDNIGSGEATSALAEIALWNADTDELVATTLQVQHVAVSGNSSVTESFDFVVPADLVPGTYFFRVQVGRLGNEPEENTSNNFSEFFEVSIGGTGGPGPADLRIDSVTLDSTTIFEGGQTTIRFTVGNYGNTDARDSRAGIYISTDDEFDIDDDDLIDARDTPSILSGDQITPSDDLQNLANYDPGTYWIFVLADLNEDVNEGPSENKNVSEGVRIEITDPSTTVDLQATLLSAPSSVVELGTTFTAVFEYENSGATLVDEVGYLAYVLDSDGNEVERRNHGTRFNFDPGETSERSVNVQVDSTYVPGNYTLVFEIDDENELAESNESNNVATFSFEVVQVTVSFDNTPNADPTGVLPDLIEFDENTNVGSIAATLSVEDPDNSDSHTLSLVDDAGGTFVLDGFDVVVNGPTDFENDPPSMIRVLATDQDGASVEETIAVNVNDVNEAPTGVTVDLTQLDENAQVGTDLGPLMVLDPDAGGSHTVSLIDDAGGLFTLDGNNLVLDGALDFETAPSIDVVVRATDQDGLSIDQTITITVNDVNEAPTAVALSASDVDEHMSTAA